MPRAGGLVCESGRIATVCDEEEARQAANEAGTTVVVIPPGGVAMPGIIESHAHFLSVGRARRQLDLSACLSPVEVAERVRLSAAGAPDGTWILGRGWNQELWPDRRFPDAGLLDAAAPRHLVFLVRVDGHADRQPIRNARFASNWELAAARAIAVAQVLIAEGLPANRVAATSFGDTQPIDPGDGAAAYARNRRIEPRLTDR